MNDSIVRTFVALKVDPQKQFLDYYRQLKSDLQKEKITWVAPENLHITLLFIGDTKTSDIDLISDALRNAIQNTPTFYATFQGLGFFPDNKQPRVLFASIPENQQLQNLGKNLSKMGNDFGVKSSYKKFTPHLTLGRIKEIRNKTRFLELIDNFQSTFFQKQKFTEIVFYKSTLTVKGAIYEPLEKFQLL